MTITFANLVDCERGRSLGYGRGGLLPFTFIIGWYGEEGKHAGGDHPGMLCEPRVKHLNESKLDDWSAAELQRFVTTGLGQSELPHQNRRVGLSALETIPKGQRSD